MQDLQYALTPDGIQVAFRVMPGGVGLPLVYLPGMVYSIESIFEDAPYSRFVDGLAEHAPVVLIERRGIGVSDPVDPTRDFYEQWGTDVVAVLDALGIDRAALVGSVIGANIALETAIRHPERVSAVVALSSVLGVPAPVLDVMRDRTQKLVAHDDGAQVDAWREIVPTRASEPAFADWFGRAGRRAASPSTAAQFWDRVLRRADLDTRVTQIQASVLILNRQGFADATGVDLGPVQALVDGMPDARLVTLDGGDAVPFAGDIDGLLFEIADFLFGGTRTVSGPRSLTTILFTDLVGSTTAARALGDADWRAVLDHHDHVIERTVRRHGGRIVKTTGDGVLATFDAPSGALRGALALHDLVAELDLGLRVGLHLGEVETRGDDVAGLAVHLAARVMAAADAGEILTTAALPLATLGSGFAFESRGRHPLKGFDADIELFRLVGKG